MIVGALHRGYQRIGLVRQPGDIPLRCIAQLRWRYFPDDQDFVDCRVVRREAQSRCFIPHKISRRTAENAVTARLCQAAAGNKVIKIGFSIKPDLIVRMGAVQDELIIDIKKRPVRAKHIKVTILLIGDMVNTCVHIRFNHSGAFIPQHSEIFQLSKFQRGGIYNSFLFGQILFRKCSFKRNTIRILISQFHESWKNIFK